MVTSKKLGIVGGMGARASNWLISRITQLSQAESDQEYLEIVLHSNARIPDRTQAIRHGGDSPLPELQRSLDVLGRSEVDVSVLACMTAYYFYDDLTPDLKFPLLHPVDMVLQELRSPALAGKKKVGLIGTTGMTRAGIYQKRLEPHGYELMLLEVEEQEQYFMYPIYRKEGFKAGVFSDENKDLFMKQIEILKERGAEVIVAACSEIPLIMERYGMTPDKLPLPFIDAFELLANKVVEYCYQ